MTARGSSTFPATVVMASTSTAGSRSASTRATASSEPVSVSITMGLFICLLSSLAAQGGRLGSLDNSIERPVE